MSDGLMGTKLEVNLTKGTIEKQPLDPELIRNYLGAKGINAKILWDRVPPEVSAFSPENLLIIGAGILTGANIPGANHTCITFKSPITDLFCYSTMGGFFSAEMKKACINNIVISGKSPKPVYLWIDDDKIELRDASKFWGKSAPETRDLLHQELGEKVRVMVIGQAGENVVYNASIEHENGASAGRGGAGAIMGAKKLKAIAVRGTKEVFIAEKDKLTPIRKKMVEKSAANRSRIVERSGLSYVLGGLRGQDFGNMSGGDYPELQPLIKEVGRKSTEYIEKNRVKEVGCSNCSIRCKGAYANADGGLTFLKCALHYPIGASQIIDMDFSNKFITICEKYGLDFKGMAHITAFAIDLYQKGIITKEDTGGLELKWRDADCIFALLEKITHRQDIGNILADGVYRAARKIGKGAEKYAYTAKRMDMPQFKRYHRHNIATMSALNDKACATKLSTQFSDVWMHRPLEEKQNVIKDGWFAYPKELEVLFLQDSDVAGKPNIEQTSVFHAYELEQFALADSAGICTYWMHYWMFPVIDRALAAELITDVSGLPIDEAEATKIARRICNLVRAYNVRAGMTRKDDFESVPKHAFERTPAPPEVKLDPAVFNQLIDRFYELRGWDKEGIPTRKSLKEAGLDYVISDLEKRGIKLS